MYNNDPIATVFGFIFAWHTLYVLLAIYLFFSCVIITRGKTAKIVETLGKPQKRARLPGISLKAPWPISKVVGIVNLQIMQADASVDVKTKNKAFIKLPVTIQYCASEDVESPVRAFYKLNNPHKQLPAYVLNNVKQTASDMTVDELYGDRHSIESAVQNGLSEQFAGFGYQVVNILIDQPQLSDEVQAAYNDVIASEQLKAAAQNKADAHMIELVGVAKAEAKSKKLQGEGIANMRKAIAEGMETAMETMKKAGMSGEDAGKMMMEVTRYDTIATAATHGNVILFDMQSPQPLASTVAALRSIPGGKGKDEAGKAQDEAGKAQDEAA